MKRPKSCRKCGTDTPHPFSHWHVWCRWCRRLKIYRGASCKACHASLRALALEIMGEL